MNRIEFRKLEERLEEIYHEEIELGIEKSKIQDKLCCVVGEEMIR